MTYFTKLSLYTIFKILYIAILFIVFIILYIKEMENMRKQGYTRDFLESGIFSRLSQNMKYLFAVSLGGSSLIANGITKLEAAKKAESLQELRNALNKEKENSILAKVQIAKTEALLKDKESHLKGKLLALSGRARTSLDGVREDINEASILEDQSLELTDQIEANKTNVEKLESITNQLRLNISLAQAKKEAAQRKLDHADQEFKDLDNDSLKLDAKHLAVFSLHEKFENLNTLGQIAVAFLFLNYAILNCVLSIVSILFGNYLLTKYNIETKYPKLGKFIALRRKFQRYYLIFSISGIVIVSLIQIIFCIFVLTL